MSLQGEELVIDGQTVDPRIDGSLTAATLVRTLDGAMSLELTIADQGMAFLTSGALTRPGKPSKRQEKFDQAAWDRFSAARLNLDGVSFRLAGSEGAYDAVPFSNKVTFEDEVATLMRLRKEARKVSRGQDTRAEFIGSLVNGAVKRGNVPFTTRSRYFSPQAGQRQSIAQPDEDGRVKGFAKGKKVKVKAATADAEQRRVLTQSLTVADQLRAGERATLALLVALIVESECRNLTGGTGTSSGPLQVISSTAVGITPRTVIDPRTGLTHGAVTSDATGPIAPGKLDPRDVKGVVRVFLLRGYAGQGGAIKYAADHPDAEVWEIAQAVQGSGAGRASNGQANYGPWAQNAADILDAWGGAGALHTLRESFAFRAGGRRNGQTFNWWDDSGDLADEVRWRRFADLNRVWFVTDEWLFERAPVFVVSGEDGNAGLREQGVFGLNYQADIGLPVAEIQVQVFLPRWGGPPGAVFEFEDMGPLTGRWLIAENRMDLMAPVETATLTLRRPAPVKKEPAPKTNTTQVTETLPEAGSVQEAIVAAAEKARKYGPPVYRYLQSRPMPDTLFPKSLQQAGPTIVLIDCSAFVTLLYKAAGAPDPNGSAYNGSGNTTTLQANGKKTNDPQPGDLVFYHNPEHVGVYVGAGKVIEMGGNPGPLKVNSDYRTIAQIRTYDLG